MKYKAAIFDMDGTLLDSSWVWQYVDKAFQKKMNIRVSGDYYDAIAHMTVAESAEYTIGEYGLEITSEELQKIWSGMALQIYKDKVRLKAGAEELLDDLKSKGVRLSLATSSFPELCELAMSNLGVIDKFDTIKYTSNIGKNKSNPDIYLSCACELGVCPDECVVFEDIYAPLEPVKGVGMGFIAVKDILNSDIKKLLIEKADYYIDDYRLFMKSTFYKNLF